MKTKGPFLAKVIIGHSEESLQLSGTFCAPFPIKEVFEIRHSVFPVKTMLGNKGIAYFGHIQLKLYCISAQDLALHLFEASLHFRGFAFFREHELHHEPVVDIKAKVQDIFVEELIEETVKVLAVVRVDIVLTEEKNLDNGELSSDPGNCQISIESSESEPGLVIEGITIE